MWVNPSTGIPPGGSAILTIPFYTQLVPTPDPTLPDQYIDWWNGDNVWMFEAGNCPSLGEIRIGVLGACNGTTPSWTRFAAVVRFRP